MANRGFEGGNRVAGPRWKSRAKLAVKLALTALVLLAVGRQVARTWRDLHERGQTLRIEAAWIALAVPTYLAGLVAFGLYFARLLKASATPIGYAAAVRAYLISHLGKYVPGKALVVVIRVGLATPHGARAATSAFATLYETLVMMAAGGLVAALGFAFGPSKTVAIPIGGLGTIQLQLAALGLALALPLLILVEPRVFPRLTKLMSLPFPDVGPEALPRLGHRTLLEGVLWSCLGWTLLGLSQLAVLRAIAPAGLPPGAWPVAIGSVALATVAGFAVPIAPGGLGIREWVLWTGLGAAIDHDRAVVSSLALRLTWVVGEALAAAVLIAFRARPGRVNP